MQSKAALVIDVRNMYTQIGRAFPGQILKYGELVSKLEEAFNLKFVHKIAYLMTDPNKAQPFIGFLKSQRFEIHCDNIAWNVEMALRCARILPTVDALVVGSNYIEHGRILGYARELGKFTYAVGTYFPTNFRDVAELYTIDKALTQERKDGGQQLELPTQSGSPLIADTIPPATP